MKKNYNKGVSLVEILVVITIFAVLGVVVSSSLILTIQGTRKSESLIKTRENLNYSLAIIERNLRNAGSIVDCPNPVTTRIDYVDQLGKSSYFSCVNTGNPGSYIASGSAVRLTPDTVKIMTCNITCLPGADNTKPPLVTIDLTIQDASASGSQGSSVSTQDKIYLRN